MGERAVGRYPGASTKIGSQPPATKPARRQPPSLPATPTPSIREDTTNQPGPSPAGADPRPAASLLLAAHRSLQILPVLVDFPWLPSRCNDNNPVAPLRCLVLDPSNTFALTTTASLRAPRNAVTITSETPPSMQTRPAETRITRLATNDWIKRDKPHLRSRRLQSGPVRRQQRASRPNSTAPIF